jgi:hypothetical protein
VRNPSRKVNSGASDRQHHSDPIFGRNAQKGDVPCRLVERLNSTRGRRSP